MALGSLHANHEVPNHHLQITYLEEYYLTNDEIAVLKSYAADMVKYIPSGAMVIELGSGSVD